MVTFIETFRELRSTQEPWCITSLVVPFLKLDFDEASSCAEPEDFRTLSNTAPWATTAAAFAVPIIAVAMVQFRKYKAQAVKIH